MNQRAKIAWKGPRKTKKWRANENEEDRCGKTHAQLNSFFSFFVLPSFVRSFLSSTVHPSIQPKGTLTYREHVRVRPTSVKHRKVFPAVHAMNERTKEPSFCFSWVSNWTDITSRVAYGKQTDIFCLSAWLPFHYLVTKKEEEQRGLE